MSNCGATIEVDDRTLTCVLPAGHFGPVHQDDQGEAWGDVDLPSEDEPS